MTRHAADPGMAQAYLELRRARLLDASRRPLHPAAVGAEPLAAERAEYLRREAEELYWNELSWEELTDEETVAGGHLTELVFSGFLAFTRGLLVEEAPHDSLAPARPHPDVVETILLFLADRYTALTAELGRGADSERLVWARAMTARLLDLVLYQLYRVSPDEWEEIEALA